ncbi:hypothetical protein N0X72_22335 [Streptomyces carpaticus]|uniref:Uncharacterized protein n=2 Tax=Streptomyces TaxID=1883 RepID=A0A1I6W299_9ACTN|nr:MULTISPECIES: hypothetical protein [Streptomyces]MCK1817110.1 hypothetical protein [Streptomyces sp. XM4011]QKV71078.1 hypothetical protein HUT13_21660 [Streptomyces harbinensis]UWM51523.1 hypothetical protein N0X72_22335 [Streptomyces carpaticus]SFT20127.1 hypothetical protein SAMN05444716_1123 [Streptomyces harbinensis]
MKSTLSVRSTANPRRTTLAHLRDADELTPAPVTYSASEELPGSTANPRRTILDKAPDAA